MTLTRELERLARLHAEGALSDEEFAKAKSLLLSGRGWGPGSARSVRRESARKLLGLPLWAVALGPDYERGEMRGHARGIVAVGDIATGWVAVGGLARGLVAVGGMAAGLFALGGCALGLLAAVGGLAVGSVALGGCAVGGIAIGGGGWGYYALGGGMAGYHPLSPAHQDPAAVDFFGRFLPFLRGLPSR